VLDPSRVPLLRLPALVLLALARLLVLLLLALARLLVLLLLALDRSQAPLLPGPGLLAVPPPPQLTVSGRLPCRIID